MIIIDRLLQGLLMSAAVFVIFTVTFSVIAKFTTPVVCTQERLVLEHKVVWALGMPRTATVGKLKCQAYGVL